MSPGRLRGRDGRIRGCGRGAVGPYRGLLRHVVSRLQPGWLRREISCKLGPDDKRQALIVMSRRWRRPVENRLIHAGKLQQERQTLEGTSSTRRCRG
eukprot:753795-Hanusia_phi.AAC.1